MVAEQLGVDPDKITLETAFVSELGGDSLDTAELIMQLEEEFDINVPDEEAENIQTLADFLRWLAKRRREE